MASSFFAKMVILQLIAFSIIIFILKVVLDRRLIQMAISEMRLWQQEARPISVKQVIVISHKTLNSNYQDRIKRITTDYFGPEVKPTFRVDSSLLGGMVIMLGDQMIECSLRDRLHQAFPK